MHVLLALELTNYIKHLRSQVHFLNHVLNHLILSLPPSLSLTHTHTHTVTALSTETLMFLCYP